jgi:hypothetical protein
MMIFTKRLLAILCLALTGITASAQQVDLFKMQDSTSSATGKEPVVNTFYSTRLVNSHTVEILSPGSMDFRINHRFGPVNQGIYEMFGLDQASMRIGFDFGIVKNLMIGVSAAHQPAKNMTGMRNGALFTRKQVAAHRFRWISLGDGL